MDSGNITLPKLKWRDALKSKAFTIGCYGIPGHFTTGYKIFWYLYSADIWFGRFPLLKFIVGVNVVVWMILFLTT